MSDSSVGGNITRGSKPQTQKRVTFNGKLSEAEWAQLVEKIKKILKDDFNDRVKLS